MGDFDLIIFDCDGTLTDSEYVNNRAFIEILEEEGVTQYDLPWAYKHWVGTTVSGILLQIQMETGRHFPKNFVPRYIDRVAQLQHSNLRAVEYAPELVAAAKTKFKICVASNGERNNVVQSLEQTGLIGNFTPESVFTKIQVKNPKPASDLFLFAAQTMGAEPERCLVIEDSAAGVRAGVAAGMTTWGFTGSSHDPAAQAQTLKSAGAHLVFERLIHIGEKRGL